MISHGPDRLAESSDRAQETPSPFRGSAFPRLQTKAPLVAARRLTGGACWYVLSATGPDSPRLGAGEAREAGSCPLFLGADGTLKSPALQECQLLQVLRQRRHKALVLHSSSTSVPGIPQTVQLFGVCEATLYRFPSTLREALSLIGLEKLPCLFPQVLVDVALDHFLLRGGMGALAQKWTRCTDRSIRSVDAVAVTVGCHVRQPLLGRAAVGIP